MEFNSNCLTYQQLSDFAATRMQGKDLLRFQQHLLDCELCSNAVKGFETAPFTIEEIIDINEKVELKALKSSFTFQDFKPLFLAATSVFLIFTFYNFVESFSKESAFSAMKAEKIMELATKNETVLPNITPAVKNRKARLKPVGVKREEMREYTLVPVEPIKTFVKEIPLENGDSSLNPVYMANAVYIHNLKVAGYFDLYFKISGKKTVDFTNHIPSSKENRGENLRFDNEVSKTVTLESILKSGLLYFSEEKYANSTAEFQKLLAANPDDINALFYMAMAYGKIADYEHSVKFFNRVLNHPDKTFLAEAKWHLALVYIADYETVKARSLLKEIAMEKGFYAKNAQRELAFIENQ